MGCICHGGPLVCRREGLRAREGLCARGSCPSIVMGSLCPHRGSSRRGVFLCHGGWCHRGSLCWKDAIPLQTPYGYGAPRSLLGLLPWKSLCPWGACAIVGDVCDNYVGVCVLGGFLARGSSVLGNLSLGFSAIIGDLSSWVPYARGAWGGNSPEGQPAWSICGPIPWQSSDPALWSVTLEWVTARMEWEERGHLGEQEQDGGPCLCLLSPHERVHLRVSLSPTCPSCAVPICSFLFRVDPEIFPGKTPGG